MVKNILIIMSIIILFYAGVYSQGTSCSIVWGEPVELSSSGILPRIAVQSDTVHITWQDGARLPYRRSVNAGQYWEPIKDLWTIDTITRFPYYQLINSTNNRLYIFYRDHFGGEVDRDRIGWVLSTDNGETWSDRKHLILTNGGEWIRCVSTSFDTILVGFDFLNPSSWPYVLRSTDAGQTWSVSPDSIPGYEMKLALSKGSLHIVQQPYYDPFPYAAPEIEYRRSYDLGHTWEKIELLSTNDGYSSMIPSIASDGKNRIFTAWRDTKYENCGSMFGCDIVGRLSTNNGISWGTEWLFTDVPLGTNSSIELYGKIFCVVWEEDDAAENYGVNARVSLDVGNSWCLPIKIGLQGHNPQAKITNGAIHIVYQAYVDNSFRIYYVRGALPEVNLTIPLQNNWNLVSVPVNASDVQKDKVFPSSISSAFAYNNTYNTTELLNTGEGYWLKFAQAETVTVSGVPIKNLDIPVRTGWNIIGSMSYPVASSAITTTPPDIFSSQFYKYENGYSVADTIQPGKGYWIKVKAEGVLHLRSSD